MKIIFCYVGILILSLQAQALKLSCNTVLSVYEIQKQVPESESTYWQQKGVSYRNFMGTTFKRNKYNEALALLEGVMWWNQRIYVVESHAEADLINQTMTANPAMKGIFAVNPEWKQRIASNNSQLDMAEYEKLLNSSELYTSVEGVVNPANPAQIMNDRLQQLSIDEKNIFLKTDSVPVYTSHEGYGEFYRINGWTNPALTGVTLVQKWQQPSTTIDNIKKTVRKLEREGYTFRLDQAFSQALEMLVQQSRKGQAPEVNRIDQETADDFKFYHDLGIFHSFEVHSPDNQLVAGFLFYVTKKEIVRETVFYTFDRNNKSLINFAKSAVYKFQTELHRQYGIEHNNTQMVSNYTKELKGFYTYTQDLNMYRDADQDTAIDWASFTQNFESSLPKEEK